MSSTYCPMPWVNVSLMPGAYQPCCMWSDVSKFKEISNLEDYQKSSQLEEIKQNMLNDRKSVGCEQCYTDEKLGLTSPRQQYIKKFGIVNETVIRSLDLALDNVCNLKCRGCASSSSHLWYEDEIKLYGKTIYPKKYTTSFDFDDLNLKDLERIDISGGEPLMNKNLDKFFNKLIDQDLLKNIYISINTNGTVTPSETMKIVFAKVKELHLNVSIDGIDELNKYFRSGADWNSCVKNFIYFDSLYDIRSAVTTQITAHTTVSIYNVNMLDEIKNYFSKNFPRIKNDHRLVYWPEFLSIKNIPQDLKNKIAPTLANYPYISEFLNSGGEDLFEHFINFHDGLDKIRNEKLTSNEFLSNYINEYKRQNPNRIDSTTYWPKHIKILVK